MKNIRIIGAFLFLSVATFAQVFAQCPDPTDCIGSSLALNGYKQYVDVPTSPSLRQISQHNELTFEAWVYFPYKQYAISAFAGVWGPSDDVDDQWLVEIDTANTLLFMLSNGSTNLNVVDNTVASYPLPQNLFRRWFHLACTWSGSDGHAKMYINGVLVADTINSTAPCSTLRNVQSYLQLGSFNGLKNSPWNRTLSGEMDEIRIWSVRRPADSIRCNLYHAINPGSPGLVAYWQANGNFDAQTLCDGTPNGNNGIIQNEARQYYSNRRNPRVLFFDPPNVDAVYASIDCRTDTSFIFRVVDTSQCDDYCTATITGFGPTSFSVTPAQFHISRGDTVLLTVHIITERTGLLTGNLLIRNNSCAPILSGIIHVRRTTQLAFSPATFTFPTVYHCGASDTVETEVAICNTSERDQIISGFSVSRPEFSVQGYSRSFPDTLKPNDCGKLGLRFHPPQVVGAYYDTVNIVSTDTCLHGKAIAIAGRSEPMLQTTTTSLDFGDLLYCTIAPSGFLIFTAFNVGIDSLVIDTIIVDSVKYKVTGPAFPTTMVPWESIEYAVRFYYGVDGDYHDTLTIRGRYKGCAIEKKISLHARVFHNRYDIAPATLSFGNVRVGQLDTISVAITNRGGLGRAISVYLKHAANFTLLSYPEFFMDTGETRTLRIQFRPTDTLSYSDSLFIQDTSCYLLTSAPLTGKGYLDRLAFSPMKISFRAIPYCRCVSDTVTVTNISSMPMLIEFPRTAGWNFSPGGVYLPVQTILPGTSVKFPITFCGTWTRDGAVTGEFIFDTNDSNNLTVHILLEGAVYSPTVIATPAFLDLGDVEVGTSKTFSFSWQNVSPIAIRIDSIPLRRFPEFALVGITASGSPVSLPFTLDPAQTAVVTVKFSPPYIYTFGGPLYGYISQPCWAYAEMYVTGNGSFEKLSVTQTVIVFRKSSRCQRDVRSVVAANLGHARITIDTMFIEGPDRGAFSWACPSVATFPATLDSSEADTVTVTYDPNGSPSVRSYATLVIVSRTYISRDVDYIQLIGVREEQFQSSQDSIPFGSRGAFMNAPPKYIRLRNVMSTQPIVIDQLAMTPDVGVFSATAPLPATLAPGEELTVRLDYKPRLDSAYYAQLRVHILSPCSELDSHIVVTGSCFTKPVYVTACFDTVIRATTTDRITVPVNLSLPIAESPADVTMLLRYNHRALDLISVDCRTCPSPVERVSTEEGEILSIRNCNALPQGKLFDLHFLALLADSTTSTIAIDSVAFSIDSSGTFAYFGEGCGSRVSINGNCNLSRVTYSTNRSHIEQTYPNPVSSGSGFQTTVKFETMEDALTTIRLVDRMGREVKQLLYGDLAHGAYQLTLDARDLESGIYFLTIESGTFRGSKSVIVIQ